MATHPETFGTQELHRGPFLSRSPAVVWRRFLAYVVDVLALNVLGYGVGATFFLQLARMGAWGRLFGFGITVLYFSLFDSSFGNGQTIGKALLRVRVIDAKGSTIPIAKSFLRAIIFSIPFFLYRIRLPGARTPWIISELVLLTMLWLESSIIFPILFKNSARQGIHDLVARTVVADASDDGPIGEEHLRRSRWIILGVLLLVISISQIAASLELRKIPPSAEMRQDEQVIEYVSGVQRAQVLDVLRHVASTGGAQKVLVVNVIVGSSDLKSESFAASLVQRVLAVDQSARNYDQVEVRLFVGYDIGIAQRWNHVEFTHKPSDWLK